MSVNRKSSSAHFVQHGSLKKQWSEPTSKRPTKAGKKSKKSKRNRKYKPVIEITPLPKPKPTVRFTKMIQKPKP